MITHRVFLALALSCVTAYAAPSGTPILQVGFNAVTEKPCSGPSLPMETQPATGEVNRDHNNLKDPQYTPTFQIRDPIMFRVPGFSVCQTNVFGQMEIDADKAADAVWMRGKNPRVSGYVGKRLLDRDASYVETTFTRLAPAEGGMVYLLVRDLVTNAFVMLASMRGEDNEGCWGITWSDDGSWVDWRAWLNAQGIDWAKPVKAAVGLTAPGKFQAYINDKPVGPVIDLPGLMHLSEFTIGADAREKGVKVLGVGAWRDDNLIAKGKSVRQIKLAALTKDTFTPANPYGVAVQVDYPFRGFSDAMNDPELFDELAAILKDLQIKLIRFPGGNSAYWYSIHGPESMDGLRELVGDYPLDRKRFGWADARQFFKLCKTVGADAVYQLNLGYWYDPEAKKAYRIALFDSQLVWPAPSDFVQPLEPKVKPLEYHLDKFKFALDDAKTLAKWAQDAQLKVIWEFGNEDLSYFCPKSYVVVSSEFYKAIKEVDPKAQFAIYGDGITWTDWSWPYAVFEEMAKTGLKDIAYTSHHEYLFGGTGIPFIDGQHVCDGGVAAWHNIRNLRDGVRKKLDELGYTQTQMAVTEGNFSAMAPLAGTPHEHGMGRALAESQIFPERIKKYAMLVHHDLVRCGPEDGTWFCRIFYDRAKPKGQRYWLPLDGEVMKVAYNHALREIIYDAGEGITVSQAADGLLATVGNALPIDRNVSLTVENFKTGAKTLEADVITADNLDTMEFRHAKIPVTVTSADGAATFGVAVPGCSFCRFRCVP